MWNLDWSNVVLAKAAAELNLISDIKRDISKFGTVFTQTRATYREIRKQNSNFHKGLELWAKSINDFGNFAIRTPFPLRDICENPRSNVRACAAGDGAICSKIRKIVPYHGANPNTRNAARLRSPSLIMGPDFILFISLIVSGRYPENPAIWLVPGTGSIFLSPDHGYGNQLR